MPRVAFVALVVLLLATGTACNDSDDPGTAAGTGSTTSAAPTPDDPTSSAAETPTAAAATGPVMKLPLSSARAPEGWDISDQLVSTMVSAEAPDSISLVSLGEIESFADHLITPDELRGIWLRNSFLEKQPKKLPNTELDGVEVYHLAGQTDRFTYTEVFGAEVQDMLFSLAFNLSTELSPQERQEIVDSVLASFHWR